MNYLETLNEKQREAVETLEGPLLIVAGAGAGKTKTLTTRIIHLIQNGVHPENILAITFTNKAAREMRERVVDMLHSFVPLPQSSGYPYYAPFVSTFHSLGVQILKENASLLSLPRHFIIFDKADSKKAVKEALEYVGVEPKDYVEKIQHIISAQKGRGVRMEEYRESGSYDYTSELAKKAWQKYEEILSRNRALDFDDLLLKTLRLLEGHPDIRKRYEEKFQHIHVDEYQDTNGVQNRIVDLLSRNHRNICVVGDTDQCIYGWRGAEIKNMLHFEKTYPEVKTVFLEENYRSTSTILSAANTIIEKNKYRIPKRLFTQNKEGELLGIFEARNEMDEAFFIAGRAKKLLEEGVQGEEIAVLFRTNFQSRALEEAFLAANVPYQVLGTKFFERKEVKDVMSYIRAALDPENTNDFGRIINVPARGIGKTSLEKIMSGNSASLPPAMQTKINMFKEKLLTFGALLRTLSPSESIKQIITESGLEEMYSKGKEEDIDRLENMYEIVTLAKNYDTLSPEEGVEALLTDTALQSDQDELDKKTAGVKLLTVHASKGLEFDYVFISGLEDGLFPHEAREHRISAEESEEERRLFYVALTRARKKIFLTWTGTRTIFGTTEVHAPSEFLLDIPEALTEREDYFERQVKKPLFSIEF